MEFALTALLTLTALPRQPGKEISTANPFVTLPPKLAVLDVKATMIAIPDKTVTRMAAAQLAHRTPIAKITTDLSQVVRTLSVFLAFVSILINA